MLSIFKNVFASKADAMADFSAIGADMHSHLIPAVDDGAKSLENSIEMIKGLINLGYKSITTTPHIMWDYYKNTTPILKLGLEKIQNELRNQKIDFKINVSAEYFADEHFEKLIQTGDLIPIAQNYVLFEVAFNNEYRNIRKVIFDLQMKGYKPIFAHPERYGHMYDDFKKYEELFDTGILFQLNILSLNGHYGPPAQKIAEQLIKNKMIRFVGTDMHNTRHLAEMPQLLKNKHLRELIDSGRLMNNQLL